MAINPICVFDKWIGKISITNEELKSLEEWTRRNGVNEHYWVNLECNRLGVEKHKGIKIWNKELRTYE